MLNIIIKFNISVRLTFHTLSMIYYHIKHNIKKKKEQLNMEDYTKLM